MKVASMTASAMSTPAWKMPPALDGLDPGVEPSDFNLLVIKDEMPEKTQGGVFLPETTRDAESWASTRARIVNISPLAFDIAKVDGVSWRDHPKRPQVGQVVQVPKGAGALVIGRDGLKYHLIGERDVQGIVSEEAAS